uniref:Uncharacterized protein n=1 Tax=Caenorhabditis japonica TaxID=281687 RepID=A0A8R1EI10_CAEJA
MPSQLERAGRNGRTGRTADEADGRRTDGRTDGPDGRKLVRMEALVAATQYMSRGSDEAHALDLVRISIQGCIRRRVQFQETIFHGG